jgi:hypothetical protein
MLKKQQFGGLFMLLFQIFDPIPATINLRLQMLFINLAPNLEELCNSKKG